MTPPPHSALSLESPPTRTLALLLAVSGVLLTACEEGSTGEDRQLAIRNVTVLSMTEAGTVAGATVVVEGDRITAVGPAADVRPPDGAEMVDGTGKFLIPGLFEMHAHLSKTRGSALGLFVSNGVTTVRDMGGDHQELAAWEREIQRGDRFGPRILLAGPYLESSENVERMRRDPPEERVEPIERTRVPVAEPEAARRIVDSLARLEPDYLKVRTVENRSTLMALAEATASQGFDLVGHTFGFPPELVVTAGIDAAEHFLYPTLDSLTRAERMEHWRTFADSGIAVVPTLVTFTESTFLSAEELRRVVEDSLGEREPRRRLLSRYLILDWREQLAEASDEGRGLFRQIYGSTLRNLREMREAGVRVFPGSDVAVINVFPGSTLHDELELFADSLEMSPMEVLRSATREPAEFLGIADSVGTIEPGKVADLVLLDADPREDVARTRRIASVVLRGAYFDGPALDSIRSVVDTMRDQRVNDWVRRQ